MYDSQTLQSLTSRGYHPIITPGKSPSHQGLDRVQWLRPPATPYDITHYTLRESKLSPYVLAYTTSSTLRISP